MDRVAIFVDAGYVFAWGSILLSGQKLQRGQLLLNVPAAIAFLEKFATETSGLPLLRTYWYDGTSSGPTTEHRTLAHSDNVKIRLGFVNQQGEQKGVDSLIVTDMISLARNGAMATAVLITGDEDIRVGVQQAQEFGVRVHLVGIQPHRQSQSTLLLQEADRVHELQLKDLQQFLSLRSSGVEVAVALDGDTSLPLVQRIARGVWAALDPAQRELLRSSLATGRIDIPQDVDRLLLKLTREQLGRDVLPEERKDMRQAFKDEARASQ